MHLPSFTQLIASSMMSWDSWLQKPTHTYTPEPRKSSHESPHPSSLQSQNILVTLLITPTPVMKQHSVSTSIRKALAEDKAWASQPGAASFTAFDEGVMGHPHPPVPVVPGVAPTGHSFYSANWMHKMHFEISTHLPHLWFKYQKPTKNREVFEPIYFHSLRLYQQIQTGLLAAEIDWLEVRRPAVFNQEAEVSLFIPQALNRTSALQCNCATQLFDSAHVSVATKGMGRRLWVGGVW